MITQAQINAETADALTDDQVEALKLLVKQAPVYYNNIGNWPLFQEKLLAEQTDPTVKTKALKAVVTAVNGLPGLVVERQGGVVFTTPSNWNSFAFDVLNILFETGYVGPTNQYILIQRPIKNLLIDDEGVELPRV